jgi:hypothetical protein
MSIFEIFAIFLHFILYCDICHVITYFSWLCDISLLQLYIIEICYVIFYHVDWILSFKLYDFLVFFVKISQCDILVYCNLSPYWANCQRSILF